MTHIAADVRGLRGRCCVSCSSGWPGVQTFAAAGEEWRAGFAPCTRAGPASVMFRLRRAARAGRRERQRARSASKLALTPADAAADPVYSAITRARHCGGRPRLACRESAAPSLRTTSTRGAAHGTHRCRITRSLAARMRAVGPVACVCGGATTWRAWPACRACAARAHTHTRAAVPKRSPSVQHVFTPRHGAPQSAGGMQLGRTFGACQSAARVRSRSAAPNRRAEGVRPDPLHTLAATCVVGGGARSF